MKVTRLQIRDLRRLQEVDIRPDPGTNLLIGDNGAGKTSVLEALHLMAYGRSFRGRVRDGLIRSGSPALEVYVEWQAAGGRGRRAGLRHAGGSWEGRLDGQPVTELGKLCAALAVVTFEPGSHALVAGGGEPRRRFMDWGLFHVEHEFLPLWRRYVRALRQRNALLKDAAPGSQLDAWDHELALAGEPLTAFRQAYLARLEDVLSGTAGRIAPSLGGATLEFLPGWRRDEMPLADALLLARDRDRAFGHTSAGPHRSDWRIRFASMPGGEALSRGQAKLAALSLLLAQAADLAGRLGEWPVVALDDMASELDASHRARVLAELRGSGAQVFVTGTEAPAVGEGPEGLCLFHVEQGRVGPG